MYGNKIIIRKTKANLIFYMAKVEILNWKSKNEIVTLYSWKAVKQKINALCRKENTIKETLIIFSQYKDKILAKKSIV